MSSAWFQQQYMLFWSISQVNILNQTEVFPLLIRPLMVSSVFQCDMQKLTVDELKRLLYDTFRDHLTMKDIENIIMTEESHLNSPESHVDIDSRFHTDWISFLAQAFWSSVITLRCANVSLQILSAASPTQQEKHTCVRKSLICAFAIAFIISVMLIAANQMLRRGMK